MAVDLKATYKLKLKIENGYSCERFNILLLKQMWPVVNLINVLTVENCIYRGRHFDHIYNVYNIFHIGLCYKIFEYVLSSSGTKWKSHKIISKPQK